MVDNELNSPDNGTLSDIFSSRAVAQILDFFLDHKEFDYSPGEIAQVRNTQNQAKPISVQEKTTAIS
ncbi:MAG TPA: hypothetical protein VE076_11800 [Nitrososphaeraceae archaeon]|nr:hypothetical protein [Nitrososphaeraceae archaeon]